MKAHEAEPETTELAPAVDTEAFETPPVEPAAEEWQPSLGGWIVRRGLLAVVFVGVLLMPAILPLDQVRVVAIAFIYIIVGLSINVLMGYLGQISLGHQAFVGFGAFTTALVVSKGDQPIFVGIVVAGLVGGASAVVLGVVALRLKGLYLALITLAYGAIAESSLFNVEAITGGSSGATAARPDWIASDRRYAYFCLAFVCMILYADWRLVKSKVGRAFFAIRDNELAAASFGINVTAYKLIAFVLSGMLAGLAGALLGHLNTIVVPTDFDFFLALTFVLMVVVGGLGSRTGVFIGSAFFALLPLLLDNLFRWGIDKPVFSWLLTLPIVKSFPEHVEFVGALLLLLTLTSFPGGIAQQIGPLLRWFGGGKIRGHHEGQAIQTGGAGVRP